MTRTHTPYTAHSDAHNPYLQLESVKATFFPSEPHGEGVYILKMSAPLGSEKHSARYYVGWTSNLEGRLHYHRKGSGAALTRAANLRGIDYEVVVWIPGASRAVERAIKNCKNTQRWINSQMKKQGLLS